MKSTAEIERKYEVGEDTVLPPLGDIAAVVAGGEVELVAEYFDTPRGDLAAQRIVLRRRHGGDDEGWHIKFPTAEGRQELHWPLTEGEPPAEVCAPVLGIVRDRPLNVIAQITTHRTILRLVTLAGTELVEVVDDIVQARDSSTGVLRRWREWEVELRDGAPTSAPERAALFTAIEDLLCAAGAAPAKSGSKLASALGTTSLAEEVLPPSLDRSSPGSAVLGLALSMLVTELLEADPRVRRNEADSVHAFRTRVRRIRGLFASYRHIFDRAATDPLRRELQHFGSLLGTARDAEVMRERARALVSDHDTVAAGVGDTLAGGWDATYLAAHARAIEELSGTRYFRLLDDLEEFVSRPVITPSAVAAASDLVPVGLDAELSRVLRRAKRAQAASGIELSELLHETRKAAKRLRYAAEAVSYGPAGVFGKRARRLAAAAEAVHDLLGEYRDSQLMQEHLAQAAPASRPAFDYGVLFEVERHSSALCLMEYPAALAELKAFR